jgi:stage V sporulation protein S
VTTAAAEEAPPPTMHARRSSTPDEMRVGASSNPQSLASVISHAIYDNKQVTLRAIGAGAICQTMKAFAIARGFVAPRGFDIAIIPGWANVVGERGDDLSAMTFKVVQLW